MRTPPCRSSAGRGGLALLSLGIALSACVPAVEQVNEENAAEGQLGIDASPTKTRLERQVFTSSSQELPFDFDCSSVSDCSLEIVVVFDEEVLRRARTLPRGLDGVQALLGLSVAGPGFDGFAQVRNFGLREPAPFPLVARYVKQGLQRGRYVGVLTRARDLPAELGVMPAQICIGAASACTQYDRYPMIRTGGLIAGSVKRWQPIDVQLGSGSYSAVSYEDIQLLQPLGDPGKFYAPRVTRSDADGEWRFDDVLPGEYTLRIADRDHRITVVPGPEQRIDDIVLD